MSDIETEQARETAEDLVALLSAYELELSLLEQDAPAVGPLRQAVGVALARAVSWIADREVESGFVSRTRH